MLMDAKWAFQTPSTFAESMPVVTTTEFVSEPIDLKTAGYADGGGELAVAFRCVNQAANAGLGCTFALKHCATVGGTYLTVSSKTLALAEITTGKFLGNLPFAPDMLQFIKFVVTPTASTNNTSNFMANVITTG